MKHRNNILAVVVLIAAFALGIFNVSRHNEQKAAALIAAQEVKLAQEQADAKQEAIQRSLASIIRLHDSVTGNFFCSGFVVSDDLAITAAHCVAERPLFVPTITVHSKAKLNIPAAVHSWEQSTDLALIEGNFSDIPKMVITTNPMMIEDSFNNNSDAIFTCGFPYGGPMICAPFKPDGKEFFRYSGTAVLYPGMSGGPVIDFNTNEAVALNTAAGLRNKVVSPLVNICYILNCNVAK